MAGIEATGTELARRLGLGDAVVIGLGSMLGAGVFVVFAPAAAAAGGAGLLVALAVAGLVAFCNATSSARLAARYPESGGAYVYGRERLNAFAGFVAGWGFVVGKTASCAAMALTIGTYLWPAYARPVAVVAVLALTAVNLRGVGQTARASRWLVVVTLLALGTVAAVGLAAGHPGVDRVGGFSGTGIRDTLTAAGLLFFAFAGYARIATLGEEVRDPRQTIPRAVPTALGLVLVTYLLLAVVCLVVLGPDRLASATAPLAEVVRAAGLPGVAWVVRVGAAVAVTGVLLALLAGIGRTTLAMARRRDLPGALDAVHPRTRVPHRAEVAVAAAVVGLVCLADLRDAIGFSSCTVLVYYAIANAAALTLPRSAAADPGEHGSERPDPGEPGSGGPGPAGGSGPDRPGPAGGPGESPGWWLPAQVLAVVGLVGCAVLALTLPWHSVLAGFAVLAVGTAFFAARRLTAGF